jgi:hypothetical protein
MSTSTSFSRTSLRRGRWWRVRVGGMSIVRIRIIVLVLIGKLTVGPVEKGDDFIHCNIDLWGEGVRKGRDRGEYVGYSRIVEGGR